MLAIDEDDSEADEGTLGSESATPHLPQVGEIQVVQLGVVGVDSGQLMITDPCYIDQQWKPRGVDHDESADVEPWHRATAGLGNTTNRRLPTYSYRGAMRATLSGAGYGELAFDLGHAGAGVVFATAWGDGIYPVYGEMHDDRIVRVYITAG